MNYLPHSISLQRAPLTMGLQHIFDPGRIFDAEANTMFPGVITLPPLKQTPTWTGGPATFKALGDGFTVTTDGTLWMHGSGAAVTDEPLWFLSGTTWTDATANADVAGDANTCSGIILVNNTYYMMTRDSFLIGGQRKWTLRSTDKTTWTNDHTTVATEGGSTTDQVYFIVNIASTLYFCFHDNNVSVGIKSRAVGNNSWSAVASILEGTESPPRGLVRFHDSVGTVDLFLGTKLGLYWIDLSAATPEKLIHTFRNPGSAQTGRLWLDTLGSRIRFLDGDNHGWFQWGPNGEPEVHYAGPESLDDPQIPMTVVPLAKTGAVTAGCRSLTRPWNYVAKGGLAASRNAWVALFDARGGAPHCPYKNSTAQRAIMAIIESGDALHIMEETAAGGHQTPFYFADITTNPDANTAYAFAATGQITTSRFNGNSPVNLKGFYKWRVRADDLTAAETLGLKFASNGGALGTSQTISAGPVAQVWVDGSASAVGLSAYDVRTEITLNRGGTNTLSPKIRDFGYGYLVAALNDDDTEIKEYTFIIDLLATVKGGLSENLKSVDDVKASLQTSLRKRVLVPLIYGPTTGGTNTKVKVTDPYLLEEAPTPSNPISQPSFPGYMTIRCRQIGFVAA